MSQHAQASSIVISVLNADDADDNPSDHSRLQRARLPMTSGNSSEVVPAETDAFYEQLLRYKYYFMAAFVVSHWLIHSSLTFLTHLYWNTKAYTYDWLLSISDEVEMVSRHRLTFPIAIYFLSR